MRVKRTPLLLLVALPLVARAQPSTTNLGTTGRKLGFEILGGIEAIRFTGTDEGAPDAKVFSASASSSLQNPVGIRFTLFYIDRSARVISGPYQVGSAAKILAFGLAVEPRLHPIANGVVVSPFLGAGLAPFARTRWRYGEYDESGVLSQRDETVTDSDGRIWNAGISVRVRRLVFQWEIIGLSGADHIFTEYYLLSIGVRF